MINFNNVFEIQMDNKQVEQISIDGVVVWGRAIWLAPIHIVNDLYVRSVLYQSKADTNVNIGKYNGGGEI